MCRDLALEESDTHLVGMIDPDCVSDEDTLAVREWRCRYEYLFADPIALLVTSCFSSMRAGAIWLVQFRVEAGHAFTLLVCPRDRRSRGRSRSRASCSGLFLPICNFS